MSRGYKLTILAIVAMAVIVVLAITNQELFSSPGEERSNAVDIAVNDEVTEVEERAELEFDPDADPYQSYLEARQAEKPIVLEFYARW